MKRILSAVVFPSAPVHLILHITRRCTLRCKTCFVDLDDRQQEELSLEELKKIASYFDRLLWLDIGGGEPFLRKDLVEIVRLFNVPCIGVPTNGFDPPLVRAKVEEMRRKTAAELRIDVSIDGFQQTNDEMRGPGAYACALETLRLLKTVGGIRLKVNTVLCEYNLPEIIEFMKFIRTFDVDFHSIILRRGPKETDPLFRCPPLDKLLKVRLDIFKLWQTYNYGFLGFDSVVLRSLQRIMFDASLRTIKEERQVPDCLAGSRHLVMYPNGDVSFCEMRPPFGTIKFREMHNLLLCTRAREERESIRKKRCCCYHNCNLLDNFVLNPIRYPEILTRVFVDSVKRAVGNSR